MGRPGGFGGNRMTRRQLVAKFFSNREMLTGVDHRSVQQKTRYLSLKGLRKDP